MRNMNKVDAHFKELSTVMLNTKLMVVIWYESGPGSTDRSWLFTIVVSPLRLI